MSHETDIFQPTKNLIRIPISDIQFNENSSNSGFNGPVSGPMWKRISTFTSAYPDMFDYSMYDRLYERFGDSQPRGGVVFGQTLKLVNSHSTCSKCHYSLEIDSYGRGCIHNCKYCYAKEQLFRRGYWNNPFPMPIDLSKVREIFYKVFETDKPNKWRSVLEQRIPIRIGSMSDAFMWIDQKYGVTQELLRILKFYNYPYIIFTRSDLVAADNYISLMDKNLCAVQFSICGTSDELTKKIEPGAPSNQRRFKALRKLSDEGFWTTVRLNPLFPTYPDGYFTDPEFVRGRFGDQVPKLDFFDIERSDEWMDQLKEAKVPSVLAGFVRLTQNAIAYVGREANVDFKTFYKPGLYSTRAESVYTPQEIAHYYKKLSEAAKQRGIRFSTCYIGTGIAEYYKHQDLWSNKKDCCDAVGNVRAFKTTAQQIPWSVREQHTNYPAEALKAKLLEGSMMTSTPKLVQTQEISNENPISP